jgi:hypothetical protein
MNTLSSREFVQRICPCAKVFRLKAPKWRASYIVYDFETILKTNFDKQLGSGITVKRAWLAAEKNIKRRMLEKLES